MNKDLIEQYTRSLSEKERREFYDHLKYYESQVDVLSAEEALEKYHNKTRVTPKYNWYGVVIISLVVVWLFGCIYGLLFLNNSL